MQWYSKTEMKIWLLSKLFKVNQSNSSIHGAFYNILYDCHDLGQESSSKAHISNDIFNGNLDYPLRLPEYPYTAAMLFDAKYSMLTYGLTWVSMPLQAPKLLLQPFFKVKKMTRRRMPLRFAI